MHNIPELPHNCNSWVIVKRGTIKGVVELWDIENVKKINFDKYEALTTLDYLQRLNESIKSNDANPIVNLPSLEKH